MDDRLSIFISFSSTELQHMLKINEFIESLGHKTYYAPRDIPFGSAYPTAIINLINKSDIFLLIFSESSQNSIWVKKELERAISKNKFVIPLRIQDVALNSYMEFLISNTQWVDAHDQLFEASADKLGKYLDTLSEKLGKKRITKTEEPKEKIPVQTRINQDKETDELYRQGKQMLEEKNYTEAFIFLLQSANNGNADAQNDLGYVYQEGLGVHENYTSALKWYTKAADQGNGEAIKNLGRMHNLGLGVEVDYEKAFLLFAKAANKNNLHAMNNIGIMYHNGEGVRQDYEKAMEWYLKAANQNFDRAQYNIGIVYNFGQGVKKDYKKAMEWYLKAANQGYAYSQNNIGVLYQNGQGVEKDYEEAVSWYLKAADQDYGVAQRNLASNISNGLGIETDHSLAFEWYAKAALNENINAVAKVVVTNYATIIEKKLNEEHDKHELIQWLSKTEEFINKSSLVDIETYREYSPYCNIYIYKMQLYTSLDDYELANKAYLKMFDKFEKIYQTFDFDFYLGSCFWNGAKVFGEYLFKTKRYEKALPILKFASKNGMKSSTEYLSQMYKEGLGVNKDETYATELIEKAKIQVFKKFTMSCDFNGTMAPYSFYVREIPDDYPYKGIEDQAIFLEEARGGSVPKETREAFIKLHNIAIENKVSFTELCVYALGENKKKDAKGE